MFNQMTNHECLMLFEFPYVTEAMTVMIQYLHEILTLLKSQLKTWQGNPVCEIT